MRLLNLFLMTAVIALGLIGMTALGGTAAEAQEEPTQDQESTECPGAREVGTVGPTDDDLEIGPFSITGERFRLTYEISDLDNAGEPFFDVTVLDAERNEIGGQVIFEAGTVQEIVNESPGRFILEARGEDLQYKITVEDCTGNGDTRPDEPPTGGSPDRDPIPADQYESDVDDPDAVIDDTESDKPLPNTGGVPLVGLVVFGIVLASAGFMILRPVIRRIP